MKTMALAEFWAALDAQGVPLGFRCFKCPICGTIQNAQDLISAGVARDNVNKYVGFSCVGRWTGAGPWRKSKPSGRGCDWTLGGLFQLHRLEVVGVTGKPHPCFELATPKEAQAHCKEQEPCPK